MSGTRWVSAHVEPWAGKGTPMRSGRDSLNVLVIFAGLWCAPASGEARLFLVPAGADPTDYAEGPTGVLLRPWQSITLDIFVEQTEPDALLAYFVVLDSATEGDTGVVAYEVGSAGINSIRGDFPFCCQEAPGVIQGPPAQFGAYNPGPRVPIDDPKYLGHLTYTASNTACGTFVIDFIDPGTVTLMWDPDGNPIPFVAEQTVIRVLDRADLDLDGQVELDDILAVLDGFQGVFESGTTELDVDIASINPCERDGLIDLFDILAVLDGFRGVDLCPDRCLPMAP